MTRGQENETTLKRTSNAKQTENRMPGGYVKAMVTDLYRVSDQI